MRLTKPQKELFDFLALGCEAVENFDSNWFYSFFNLKNGVDCELLKIAFKKKGLKMIENKTQIIIKCKN